MLYETSFVTRSVGLQWLQEWIRSKNWAKHLLSGHSNMLFRLRFD